MAIVKPFAAVRPDPAVAAELCELPYDVLSSSEARARAEGNRLSFFHVSKPEIDLDLGVGLYDERVYRKGAENFQRLFAQRALRQDARPAFYLYRLVMGAQAQLGLVAVASCDEYARNIVRKHELTRPDKEDDRVRHIEALNAQTGPAFLIYPAVRALSQCLHQLAEHPPQIDFTAQDGVRHSSWTVTDPATEQLIEREFARMPLLYIADGHHRSAAAARVCKQRGAAGSSGYFLSVIFPDDEVRILPYHRVLKDLNGLTPQQLFQRLPNVFVTIAADGAAPSRPNELGLYIAGQWRRLQFRPELIAQNSPTERLDVALLQSHVLGPIFGIDDPRTSKRIDFVGGIRGTPELERLVNTGQAACAFAMFPTRVADLVAVADAGGIMPPKSTWFEPKLRDGMFSHMIGEA